MLVLGISTIVLAVRFFWLINRDAVNLLFSDQWDAYNPMFRGYGLWGMFTYQHGSHLQGLGAWLIYVYASLTHWNSRADAFVVGSIVALAMPLALVLKYRLFGAFAVSDVCIPLIVLTLSQYETLTVAPNPAPSALPLLFIVAYALAWTISSRMLRYLSVLMLNIGLVYTGYSFFMGLGTVILLGLECVQYLQQRAWHLAGQSTVALAAAAATFASFLSLYRFAPTVGCFRFPYERPWEYLWFMSLMLVRFVGFDFALAPFLATWIGAILLTIAIGIMAQRALRLVRNGVTSDAASLSIVILLGFTLIYATNAAVGRVCLGPNLAQSSRYMTLVIPAFLGIYLHFLTLRPRLRMIMIVLFVMLLLPIPLAVRASDADASGGWRQVKQVWKACYLKHGTIERCGRVAGRLPYPAAAPLQPKLAYLHEHQLNLFLDKH